MANTYTWTVTGLDCVQTPQTNTVYNVNFTVTGTNGTHTGTWSSSQGIDYNANNTYVPFSSLTNATVLEWLHTQIGVNGVNAIQDCIDHQIANQTSASPALPW